MRRTQIVLLLVLAGVGSWAASARGTTITPSFTYSWGGMGSSMTLDASATALSDVTAGDALALYAWDLDGNGTHDLSTGAAVSAVPFSLLWSIFGPIDLGDTAAVTLTATTALGSQNSITRVIHFTVPNAITDPPSAAPVPEPGTLLLLGTGLVGLARAGRRRRTP